MANYVIIVHQLEAFIMTTKLEMTTEQSTYVEKKNAQSGLSWEQLELKVQNMTRMVKENDFTGKFKRTEFGVFFNDAFYDQPHGKSRFEKSTYVNGFNILIAFKWTDINFDIETNKMAHYAQQYKDISDIEELTFVFECSFKDAELKELKSCESTYIEIARSGATADGASCVADVETIEQLNRQLWNSPDYCTTVRERVLFFIFEFDYFVKTHEMSFETIVKDYKGTQQCIKDLLLVQEMNKI